MHVNISVTVKTDDRISLCNGGKWEESDRYNYFLVAFYVLQVKQISSCACFVE